ncbi:methylmalonyl-CoA mutase [Christiangramia fulva]|uniref:Methylmalonyl-CoA mutase n=1 Tax=Christiangramia fulva TaxID=2126553 RepID=A0A2R3Z6X4_9FLAO|nr:methylmalonyl-CoA mutase subunit beta [Christiangramia fulva]AVR45952.1 methylmalonyl-CoA mutase [Christiangramia fulva]
MKELLFQEFEQVSAKQWKQKIQADLKGADYNETLVTHSLHGIDIKPFYTSEDVQETLKINNPANWKVTEKIYAVSAETALKKALNAIEKGAEAIWFTIPSADIEAETLLKGLPQEIDLYFDLLFLDPGYAAKLNKYLEGRSGKSFLQTDIIGKLARSGNWFDNLKKDHEDLEKIVQNSSNFSSIISVDASLFQNAGANIPQQLSYSIAQLTEYFNYFSGNTSAKKNPVQFKVSVGADYFMEIAKIRALRWLYSTIAEEFGWSETCEILTFPGKRNKTIYDYNVNLLRTTTECMSAILGGADAICNFPYDIVYHKDNEFGSRIARNQLLILKNESYFDKVGNIAEGTYYIESLTIQLAEKALEIFKEVEKGGGFLKELKAGTIQRKIKESARAEQEAFDEQKLVLIGTNKFENQQDRMKNELELFPFLKKKHRKTLLEPILEKRLSEDYEKRRLETEENSKN